MFLLNEARHGLAHNGRRRVLRRHQRLLPRGSSEGVPIPKSKKKKNPLHRDRKQLGAARAVARTSCSVRCTTICLFATQRPSVSRVAAISASFCAMSPSRRLRGEFVRAGDSE